MTKKALKLASLLLTVLTAHTSLKQPINHAYALSTQHSLFLCKKDGLRSHVLTTCVSARKDRNKNLKVVHIKRLGQDTEEIETFYAPCIAFDLWAKNKQVDKYHCFEDDHPMAISR